MNRDCKPNPGPIRVSTQDRPSPSRVPNPMTGPSPTTKRVPSPKPDRPSPMTMTDPTTMMKSMATTMTGPNTSHNNSKPTANTTRGC